jgi:hypothetical protein
MNVENLSMDKWVRKLKLEREGKPGGSSARARKTARIVTYNGDSLSRYRATKLMKALNLVSG